MVTPLQKLDQLEWLKRQLFGTKSEKRLPLPDPKQLTLVGELPLPETPPELPSKPIAAHTRRHGKPCIRGLRYPVENILEWLAGGMSVDEILSDYEDLEREDILAALSYVARLMPRSLPLPGEMRALS